MSSFHSAGAVEAKELKPSNKLAQVTSSGIWQSGFVNYQISEQRESPQILL